MAASNLPKKHHNLAAKFLGIIYITVFTFSALYAPQPLLPSINAEYRELSEATVTLLMTVALFPLAVAPLFYGAFLSSLSSRKILIAALLLLGGSGLAISLCSNFAVMLAARMCQGLCIPAVLTCLMAHISVKFRGVLLQRAMSAYIGATILGGLSGRIISGFLADMINWRGAITIISFAVMLGAVPAAFLQSRGKPKFTAVKPEEFKKIFKTPGIAWLMLIDALGFFVFAAISNCLPFRLSQLNPEMSDLRISMMYMGYGIGVFLAFGSRRVVRLFGGEGRAIAAGMSIYLLALPVFLMPGTLFAFIAMCIVCTGQFTEHGISPGLINSLTRLDKGATNGLYLSVYYAGGALGSYLPGLVYQSLGWEAFLSVLAVFLLIAIFGGLAVHKIMRRVQAGA